MNRLSLEPDENMRWIYKKSDQRYNDPRTKWLRERRAAAIRNAPDWMVRDAQLNDALKERNS